MFMRGAAMRFPIHNLTKLSSVFQCVTQSLSSSSTAAPDTKLYELRQYAIRPDSIVKFMELTKERFHLRLAHSKLLGFFTVELGDLGKVLHIWEYDSFEHRRGVRENLSKDPVWISQYVQPMTTLLTSQTNALLRRVSGCGSASEDKDGSKSVYGFQTRILKPDAGPQVFGRLENSNISEILPSSTIGVWRGVFGPTPTLYSLHRFSSFDSMGPFSPGGVKEEKKILETKMFLDSHSVSVSNLGLHPTSWSPLQ